MEKNQSNQQPQKTKSTRYLVAGSIGLLEALTELKFEEIESNGSGYKKIQVFKKDEKYIKITQHQLYVYIKDINGKEILIERGGIISDEYLKFFANRAFKTIIDHAKERKGIL